MPDLLVAILYQLPCANTELYCPYRLVAKSIKIKARRNSFFITAKLSIIYKNKAKTLKKCNYYIISLLAKVDNK